MAAIRERIAGAGGREVELIAVTKTFPASAIDAVLAAGCRAIGENYAQEAVAKLAERGAAPRPEVHFIGRLQTNKVRMLAPFVDVWQSVDRGSAVDELARRVPGARIFVQVNVDHDPAKAGCDPAVAGALVDAARAGGLLVEGLMTIGRQGSEIDVASGFTALRALADELNLAGCSMGMSGDLELAVRCGATHVRIGSALFGARVRAGGQSLG